MDEHSKLNVNGEFRSLVNTMFGPLAWGVFDARGDIDLGGAGSGHGRGHVASLDAPCQHPW